MRHKLSPDWEIHRALTTIYWQPAFCHTSGPNWKSQLQSALSPSPPSKGQLSYYRNGLLLSSHLPSKPLGWRSMSQSFLTYGLSYRKDGSMCLPNKGMHSALQFQRLHGISVFGREASNFSWFSADSPCPLCLFKVKGTVISPLKLCKGVTWSDKGSKRIKTGMFQWHLSIYIVPVKK